MSHFGKTLKGVYQVCNLDGKTNKKSCQIYSTKKAETAGSVRR